MLLPSFKTWHVNKSDLTAEDEKNSVSPENVLCSPENEDG